MRSPRRFLGLFSFLKISEIAQSFQAFVEYKNLPTPCKKIFLFLLAYPRAMNKLIDWVTIFCIIVMIVIRSSR